MAEIEESLFIIDTQVCPVNCAFLSLKEKRSPCCFGYYSENVKGNTTSKWPCSASPCFYLSLGICMCK